MELRHLRYFEAVADELNFTHAAQKLHVSQPSLTRQIHDLEDELGVQLFDRTKTHVSLTEAGAHFLVDVRHLLKLSQESVRSVQQIGHGESGRLNLGYQISSHFDLLPKTLAQFSQVSPGTTINLLEMSPTAQLRALEAVSIDMAFVGLRPPVDKEAVELIWQRVARRNVILALPRTHALAKKSEISLMDMKSLFFVSLSDTIQPGTDEWINGICKPAGFTPKILQKVERESDIMSLVADGLAVALTHEDTRKLHFSGVVFRPLATPEKMEYWVAWHSRHTSRPLLKYIEIIRQSATDSE